LPRPMLIAPLAIAFLRMLGGWMVPGARGLGVLSCTVGAVLDTRTAAETTAASETREMVCAFKMGRSGAEESYGAVVKSVTAMGRLPERLTLLFLVKGSFSTRLTPGLLQQTYALDPSAAHPATAALGGERNADISLQPLTEREPGSAAQERDATPRYVITAVELVLKTAMG